ncbi:Fe-S cluster assembly protein dre2 [Paramyrothecium foliicola]|nr:Fe-S cluster assembly protein dre2 [Paramyrothecium foliicola]
MKFGAAAFAVAAGAFVIPEQPGQLPLRAAEEKTIPEFEVVGSEKAAESHRHHDAAWLNFLPGKDALVSAYDDAVDFMTSRVDNAATTLHGWVDEAIADKVYGGHGHDDEDYGSRTIYEIINDNEHTKHFAKLINERPHLVELLNSTKTNSTLFVPIDEAFEHIPDDDKHKPSKEFIDDLVLYHIGLGNFPVHHVLDTHTFPTHLQEKYLGGEPQRLRIRVGFTGVRVNFYSKVVKAVEAKNGIIAAVRNILVPPPWIGKELSLFPDRFSTLLLAYEKTDFSNYLHKLHTDGNTLFAPSNNAFSRLGPRANAFLFNSEPGLRYLRAILKYHIAPNATLYSDTFYDKTGDKSETTKLDVDAKEAKHFDLPTLLENAHLGVDIGKSWGFLTVRVNGFTNVVVQDGVAKNGVVHVLSKVLLPPHKHHDHGHKTQEEDDDNEDISVEELKARLADYVEEEKDEEQSEEKNEWLELLIAYTTAFRASAAERTAPPAMSPSFVTIDTSDDFSPAPAVTKNVSAASRTLLLAPPSVAAHEEKLRSVFSSFDRASTDLQMIDRLSAGLVSLPAASYDLILVLTDDDGARRPEALSLLSRNVYAALVPSMRLGAKLKAQDGPLNPADAREAVLAGLVNNGGAFEKVEEEEVVVPLRLGGNKKKSKAVPVQVQLDDLDGGDDDDDIIDEDTLLTDQDLARPIQQPPECQPKPGRRRRACKDCTCGLAAQLEAEDKARRDKADKDLSALRLQSDDLNELDFTVEGKTGSCGNCSLGDAFRCDGCPYIGLPPFKPGEEVRLLNDVAQL